MDYGSSDSRTGTMRTVAMPYERAITPPADKTMDRMASRVAGLLRAKLDVLQDAFAGDISIYATGGTDNRLFLAGLLANGAKPGLVYGAGSRFGTQPEDLAIIHMYAESFGLTLDVVDWEENDADETGHYDKWFEEYGFFGIYGYTRSFFESFASGVFGSSALYLSGLYIDMIRMAGSLDRSRHWQERFSAEHFKPAQFMEFHLSRFNSHARQAMEEVPDEKFSEYIQTKLEDNAARFGVDKKGGRYRRESFQLLYDPWVRSAHPPWENLVNEFTCLVSVFNTHDLHELAFEIPFEWKRNNQFALRVLQQLYPQLLEFPFFSHGRRVLLRREPLELREPKVAELTHRTLQLLQRNRATRAVHTVLRPLHLSRLLLALDGTLRKDRRNRRRLRQEAAKTNGEGIMEVAKAFVDTEQQKAGLRLIDPQAFTGDVRDLLKYGKLLYFARKIREESAARKDSRAPLSFPGKP